MIDTTVPLVPPGVMRVQLPAAGCAALEARTIWGPGVRLVSAFHNVAAHRLATEEGVECAVMVFGDDADARGQVVALIEHGDAGAGGRIARQFRGGRGANLIPDLHEPDVQGGRRRHPLHAVPHRGRACADRMRWTALIPRKHGHECKTRLAACPDADARAALSDRVVPVLATAPAIGRIVLLDPAAPAGWAHGWIGDAGRGLNAELAAARTALHGDLLIVHADLPLPARGNMLAAARVTGAGIAPDRHGLSTNALAGSARRASRATARS